MKNVKSITVAALIAMSSVTAFAQGYGNSPGYGPGGTHSTPRIDQRQAEQERRINEGVRRGLITPREEQRLRQEQRHIRQEERRLMRDGRMSRSDREYMDRLLDDADRHITHEMRDRNRR